MNYVRALTAVGPGREGLGQFPQMLSQDRVLLEDSADRPPTLPGKKPTRQTRRWENKGRNGPVSREDCAVLVPLLNRDADSLSGPELAIQNSLIACLIVCEITARLSVTG